MSRKALIILGVLAAAVAIVLTTNYLILQRPMSEILKADPRNDGISVSVHFSNY